MLNAVFLGWNAEFIGHLASGKLPGCFLKVKCCSCKQRCSFTQPLDVSASVASSVTGRQFFISPALVSVVLSRNGAFNFN